MSLFFSIFILKHICRIILVNHNTFIITLLFLFLIYINDIGNSISDIPIKLFADDTNLSYLIKSIDVLKSDADNKIKFLNYSWFVANKLSFSLDKTCYSLVFMDQQMFKNLKSTLKTDDVEIQQVGCSKYLGMLIDSKLSWQNHTDYVYYKIIKFTSIFYKIRDKINSDVAKVVCFALVHSHLAYSIEIYGNIYTNHLNRLMIGGRPRRFGLIIPVRI